MNFNIIDGNDNYLQLTHEFSQLYNNPKIPITTIKKTLKINNNTYNKLIRETEQKGLIKRRRRPYKKKTSYRKKPKHYYLLRHGKYQYYCIRYLGEYYCICKTIEETEYVIKKLKECNWDKKQLKKIRSDYTRPQS